MIEMAWLALVTTGIVVSAIGLKHAHDGVRSPLNQHNGSRIVARGYRRGEALTLTMQLILFAMAVPALANPEPVKLSPFVLALFAINAGLLLRSAGDLVDRTRIRAMRHRGGDLT